MTEDKRSTVVHTTPNPDGGWDIQQNGEKVSHRRTKEAAEKRGREEARKDRTEHKIHNTDGKIAESNSYGRDPYPPKG
ncbi:DUF2188 domain-containing protein [Paenibacillus mucilaginosus]|uniref:DUF2188 domain-containing protein n=1 Tax=Paenibacillus mucilaginosus (strain KNP414) TaxID=1036673 RepID=F8FLI1_PAEMK|nr:DUF2188 domain-containing protein [Paenibacillus mucilaginosus]AEI44108.1 hypothetical protein KNP414_05584 [Paenibacillus mucilaginosus KNP414]MCG7212417.1 DUF2188 domain-containing protein [Paenibacillus mucilaginosus]WDM25542.1 DUF2188 domain-containing protein [Paenibacillus mucilaginosus]